MCRKVLFLFIWVNYLNVSLNGTSMVYIHNMNFSNMLSRLYRSLFDLLELLLGSLVIMISFFRSLKFSNRDS